MWSKRNSFSYYKWTDTPLHLQPSIKGVVVEMKLTQSSMIDTYQTLTSSNSHSSNSLVFFHSKTRHLITLIRIWYVLSFLKMYSYSCNIKLTEQSGLSNRFHQLTSPLHQLEALPVNIILSKKPTPHPTFQKLWTSTALHFDYHTWYPSPPPPPAPPAETGFPSQPIHLPTFAPQRPMSVFRAST